MRFKQPDGRFVEVKDQLTITTLLQQGWEPQKPEKEVVPQRGKTEEPTVKKNKGK